MTTAAQPDGPQGIQALAREALRAEASMFEQAVRSYEFWGSPAGLAQVDREAAAHEPSSKEKEQLLDETMGECWLLVANASTHFKALYSLYVADEVPAGVPSTLTRVMIESSARLVYVLAGESPEMRLRRGAWILFESAQYKVKFASAQASKGTQTGTGTADRGLDELKDLLTGAGLQPRLDRRNRIVDWKWPSGNADHSKKATEMVVEAFPRLRGLYGLMSGSVHGARWVTRHNVSQGAEGLEYAIKPFELGTVPMIAIRAADVILEALERYFGHPPANAATRSSEARYALANAVQQAER